MCDSAFFFYSTSSFWQIELLFILQLFILFFYLFYTQTYRLIKHNTGKCRISGSHAFWFVLLAL